MRKQWTLTQEAFERLLAWLNDDREQAGQTYEDIRLMLVKYFAWRGCTDAEEMADETINRVNRRMGEMTLVNDGNPARYFFGVARKVLKEWRRKEHPQSLEQDAPAPPEDGADDDAEDRARRMRECLAICLRALPAAERELILKYYEKSKQAKIDFRKLLAQQLKLEPTALRVKAHRIQVKIEKCINECMARRAGL